MDIYYVIKAPLITEKISLQKGEEKIYGFKVDPSATKIDIRRAVENIFKVNVTDVRTISVHGKPFRNPRSKKPSKGENWKKALVTLKKGEKIELFEGV